MAVTAGHVPAAGPRRGAVLLVRHGRTSRNAARTLMGRDDVDLDDVGRRQAAAAAAAIASWEPTAVWSSPLRRAAGTARSIATLARVPVRVEPGLAEMDFGTAVASGGRRPKLDVKGRHRYVPLPAGESLYDVWRRLLPVAGELRRRRTVGSAVVAVGHYRTNQLLEAMLAGCTFDEACERELYRPRNGSVYVLGDEPTCVWTPPPDVS